MRTFLNVDVFKLNSDAKENIMLRKIEIQDELSQPGGEGNFHAGAVGKHATWSASHQPAEEGELTCQSMHTRSAYHRRSSLSSTEFC